MAYHGKKYRAAAAAIDQTRLYSVEEALAALKSFAAAGFDQTVELVMKLGIDPARAEQMVRGTVSLPHGTGKKLRILAFCSPEQVEAAQAAGADFAGGKELVDKIKGGWLEFDVAVAGKEMMREITPLGKILGPRGLMPSPKAGTVSDNLPRTVKEVKAGKIEFKTDKSGNIQVAAGKISFPEANLAENIRAVLKEIIRVRPASAKGKYLLQVFISLTMSPSVKLDAGKLAEAT
jgi:large subunit ribosomal protein L1